MRRSARRATTGIVRDHDDGAPLLVEFAQQAQDDFFVHGVEIAGGLVGQNNLWIVDQGARNADALLLASGELRRQVTGAVFEAHAVERFERFFFVGHAVEVLREHDVLNRGEIGNHVKLLKDKADGFGANVIEIGGAEAGDVLSVKPDFASGGAVEASDEIDHGALAGTRGPHHRDPLAGRNGERDVVQSFNATALRSAIACLSFQLLAASDKLFGDVDLSQTLFNAHRSLLSPQNNSWLHAPQ